MKFFLLSYLIILSAHSFCQPSTVNNIPSLNLVANKIVYEATIPTDSAISKEILFGRAQQWYKKHIESSDNRLTVNKPDSGILSGTGTIHTRNHEKHSEPYDISFTIDIMINKGACHYRLYNKYSFEGTGRLYYSDMYNEALYPPAKPKWPAPYRAAMLNHMNDMVTTVLQGLGNAIKNGEER